MIIGGQTSTTHNLKLDTELWNLSNGDKEIIGPIIQDKTYHLGIGLYVVPIDFCSKQ